MDVFVMSGSVSEFLESKGAVGLLSLLHENGAMTYSVIESEIDVSSSTIAKRRDEAAELGLVRLSLGEGEIGTSRVNHLTKMGEALTQQLERNGVTNNYLAMRKHQDIVEEQTDAVIEWVEANPSQLLEFEEARNGTIVRDDVDDSSDNYETDITAETALPDEESEKTESSDAEEPGEETARGHQRDLNEAIEKSPETDPDTSEEEEDSPEN